MAGHIARLGYAHPFCRHVGKGAKRETLHFSQRPHGWLGWGWEDDSFFGDRSDEGLTVVVAGARFVDGRAEGEPAQWGPALGEGGIDGLFQVLGGFFFDDFVFHKKGEEGPVPGPSCPCSAMLHYSMPLLF